MSNNFSFSKLDTYDQCHYKYKLCYVDGNYIHGSNIAVEIGTLIHQTEEAIAKAILENQSINYIELKNNVLIKLNEIEHRYPEDFVKPDKAGRTYAEKVNTYLRSSIYYLETFCKKSEYELVDTEKSFTIDIDDHTFTGSIDRVFRHKVTGALLVQDIKTYSQPVEQNKLATPLQFVIYCLAAEAIYGQPADTIKCQYYLPFFLTELGFGLAQDAGTAGFISRGKKKLDNLFLEINAGNYAPTPSPLCNYCQYCITNPDSTEPGKYLCPYFSHWTRDNRIMGIVENQWLGIDFDKEIVERYQQKAKADVKIII